MKISRGVPYQVDVDRIVRIWPVSKMKVGMKIEYSSIEELCGLEYRTARWCGVTDAWRRQVERESGLIVGCIAHEKAFVVLNSTERVHLADSKVRTAGKAIRRAVRVASRTGDDGLSDEDKRRRDHLVIAGAKLQAAHEAALLRAKE